MEIYSDFLVPTLGKCSIDSPFNLGTTKGDHQFDFVEDSERILYDDTIKNYESCIKEGIPPLSFEVAGPRKKIYFDASKVKAAIVTCGGLCPGLIGGYLRPEANRNGITPQRGALPNPGQ
jgi:6-phosphofructokinase 1